MIDHWSTFWIGWTCGTTVGLFVGLGIAWWLLSQSKQPQE